MVDTPEKPTTVDSPEIGQQADKPVMLSETPKKSVAGEALKGGFDLGGPMVGLAAIFNVPFQARNRSKKFFQSFPEKWPETFNFNPKSFSKWIGIGAGIGFVAGAISSAMGAQRHNREIEEVKNFAEKYKAEKAKRRGAEQVAAPCYTLRIGPG